MVKINLVDIESASLFIAYHSGPEALTIIFEKFWFLCLRVAALAYVDAYTMLKVFYEKQI